MGKMGLSPTAFWDMSLYEFYQASEGFAEFHSGGQPKPLTRNELDDLMEKYPD